MLIAGFITLVVFWLLYSKVLSWINDASYKDALCKDSLSYTPFLLFLLYPLADFIAVKQYQVPYVHYFARALTLTPALAGCVFIKAISMRPRLDSFRAAFTLGHKQMLAPVKAFYLLLAMMAGFVFIMSAVNFTQHNSLGYRSHSVLNLLTNICRGRLTYTMNDVGARVSIFHHHLYPIFLVIAPFFKLLGADAYALIFIQTLSISLGALPIYWLASRRLGEFTGVAFSLCYLLSSILWISNLWSISARAFAVPILCFLLYFLIERRRLLTAVFAIATLACGEVMAPIVFMLGLYLMIVNKRMGLGLFLAVLSLLYIIAAIKISILSLGGIYSHQKVASSVISMISQPHLLIQFLKGLPPRKIVTIFLLLFQTGYLGLFAPLLLLSMLPIIFVNFAGPWAADVKTSYVWAPLIPVTIFSAILGASNLSRFNLFKKNKNAIAAISLYVFVSGLAGYLLFNPFRVYTLYKSQDRFIVEYRDTRIRELLKLIPKDVSVATTFNLYSHLADREDIFGLPGIPVERATDDETLDFKYPYIKDAEYVAIDIYDDFIDIGARNPVIQDILHYPDYGVVGFSQGAVILKKGGRSNFYEFVQASTDQIAHKKNIYFQDKLAFLGYNIEGLPATPGSVITLTYFWKPLVDVDKDYLVMTNLYRTYTTRQLRYIHEPLYGIWPTSRWKAGDIIKDEFTIKLPADLVITERPFVIEVYLLESLDSETDEIIKKKYLKKEILHSSPNIVGELGVIADL